MGRSVTASNRPTAPEIERIHGWFGLSYANYLVLPRSLLQSMPDEWQDRFVSCLDEYRDHWGYDTPEAKDPPGGYQVTARDERGRFAPHPAPHYRRGRTRVRPNNGL